MVLGWSWLARRRRGKRKKEFEDGRWELGEKDIFISVLLPLVLGFCAQLIHSFTHSLIPSIQNIFRSIPPALLTRPHLTDSDDDGRQSTGNGNNCCQRPLHSKLTSRPAFAVYLCPRVLHEKDHRRSIINIVRHHSTPNLHHLHHRVALSCKSDCLDLTSNNSTSTRIKKSGERAQLSQTTIQNQRPKPSPPAIQSCEVPTQNHPISSHLPPASLGAHGLRIQDLKRAVSHAAAQDKKLNNRSLPFGTLDPIGLGLSSSRPLIFW